MNFFRPPSQSRFDLNFTVLDFPVQVTPLFWVITVLFGIGLFNIWLILLWIVVVFVSILIHELGHALAMRMYGQDAYIVLHFGGLAVPVSSRWGGPASRETTEQVVISLAGPIAGFLFAGLTLLLALAVGGEVSIDWLLFVIPIPSATVPGGFLVNGLVSLILWVNIFWGLINLVPTYPLDGGQVSRALFVQRDPWDGYRKSLWVSVIAGGIMAVVGWLLLDSIYLAFLFGVLALQSYTEVQGRGV